MPWNTDDNHAFAGIAEKLKRADQNILNLHIEILRFFEGCDYPVIPHPDSEEWQKAVNYHKVLPIPKRFSVLAGEIVHHLRSCLDHIVWIFSNDAYRRTHQSAIEFPVICSVPDKDILKRLERQIKGVDKPAVRNLITKLQPYQTATASNDSLCIIHDMDRFDKHRELVIVTSCANLTFPNIPDDLRSVIMSYAKTKTISTADVDAFQKAVKHDAKVTPQVAFAKFGNRQGQFVVPSLKHLLDFTVDAVGLFAGEL